MARIITNRDIERGVHLDVFQTHCTYNALDCCVTREVWDVLKPRLDPVKDRTYRFDLAMQKPFMAMMFRGVLVDNLARAEAIKTLKKDFAEAELRLQRVIGPVWDGTEKETGPCPQSKRADGKHSWPRLNVKPTEPQTDPESMHCTQCGAPRLKHSAFNPLSDNQGLKLFYEKLGLPKLTNKKGNVSVDKEVLDRIANRYEKHAPIARGILECRGIWKQISVLESAVSPDGRMRSSFNVGGANTGRASSNANPFGDGTNLQNIAEKLRFIFIADPGRELGYADLEQAESNVVAHLAADPGYIDAHKSGDVHTYVSRMLWPEYAWTGDLARDKKLAESTFLDWDPDHPIRYNAKRVQHGSNYLLSPYGLARIAHIPQKAAADAQKRYFGAFPGIRLWQNSIKDQIKNGPAILENALGRRHQFFGRQWDEHTHKQAVAYGPQSLVGDILNIALYRVWEELDPDRVWLLAQIHDAMLVSFIKGDTAAHQRLLDLMAVPVHITGIDGVTRTLTIGTDMKIGGNWGKWHETKNPNGMK